MTIYTWNKFSRLAGEYSLTDAQMSEIKEGVFDLARNQGAGLHDIALKLKDMVWARTGPVPARIFRREEDSYKVRLPLARLLVRLIEKERGGDQTEKKAAASWDPAGRFVLEYVDIFDSDVLSVYLLEAAADLFETSQQNKRGRKLSNYIWVQNIFDKAGLYQNLLSCYEALEEPAKEETSAFFLRLFLLYRSLDPELENEHAYDLRKAVFQIVTLITKPVKERGEYAAGLDDSDYGYDRGINEEVLSVMRTYVKYLPDHDIEMQLQMIPERLSGRYNSMAAEAADILICQWAHGDSFFKSRLRLWFIDLRVLTYMCLRVSEKAEAANTESVSKLDAAPINWMNFASAYIKRNNRQLIRLDSDENGVRVSFRGGYKLKRGADRSADWTEDQLSSAAEWCRNLWNNLPEKATFHFSYVYLENYRSLEKMEVSFDHRYSMKNGQIQKEPLEHANPYFYGSSIYSLTCLVGRNGAGKSSIVDFLRESFLAIKIDTDEGILQWENDALLLNGGDEEKYHLLSGNTLTKFFVIFNVEGEDRYLTNFESGTILHSGIEGLYPYMPAAEKDSSGSITSPEQTDHSAWEEEHNHDEGMNFTEEDCNFVYFSQFCYPEGVYSSQHIGEELTYKNKLENYVKDLSEQKNEIQVRQRYLANPGGVKGINESLLQQMVFLMMAMKKPDQVSAALTKDECDYYKTLKVIINRGRNNTIQVRRIASGSDRLQEAELLDILRDQEAFIGPFSSGQYSRINLLSRIYWCLAGADAFIEEYSGRWPALCEMVKEYEASCKNRLTAENTGVLFFDEGDLCFHPEWQRTYLNDITSMVSTLRMQDVQIIVTTNSPFMLSDILRKDVYSLHGVQEDIPGLDQALQTYGQNIHMLLAHHFFLKSTVGKMSEDTLVWLRNLLRDYSISQAQEDPEKVKQGEKKMRESLWNKYGEYLEERFPGPNHTENSADTISKDDIRTFLSDLTGSIGERVYRVILKDELERSFGK